MEKCAPVQDICARGHRASPPIVLNSTTSCSSARNLASHGDLGAEWPSLSGLDGFTFVELEVARQFVAGCANDRRKQTTCRRIIDLADAMGARAVADGVENRADLLAARELGFNLAQGALFAKPMTAKNFARSVLGRRSPWPLA